MCDFNVVVQSRPVMSEGNASETLCCAVAAMDIKRDGHGSDSSVGKNSRQSATPQAPAQTKVVEVPNGDGATGSGHANRHAEPQGYDAPRKGAKGKNGESPLKFALSVCQSSTGAHALLRVVAICGWSQAGHDGSPNLRHDRTTAAAPTTTTTTWATRQPRGNQRTERRCTTARPWWTAQLRRLPPQARRPLPLCLQAAQTRRVCRREQFSG